MNYLISYSLLYLLVFIDTVDLTVLEGSISVQIISLDKILLKKKILLPELF